LLVAIGIGLHNLGEGLAIGSAYAVGALALGAFLVIGFALHNTTEGLAIVAPLAQRTPRLRHLFALGLIAGAPAIPGAWIGFAAFNPSTAALLFGVGVGAIARVIWQLVPAMRDGAGRALHPATVAGLFAGMLALYLTGLLVAV
jgi:zinc transporter ZupT